MKNIASRTINAAICLLLAACGSSGGIVVEKVTTANRPVIQPCAGTRPSKQSTLKQDYPDQAWARMDVRQKAAAVGTKGLEQKGYGELLDAATASCP